MSKKLYYQMTMNNGTTKTYSIDEPRSNVTAAEAAIPMNLAIEKEFFTIGLVKPIAIKRTYLQEIIITDLD